MTAKVVPTPGRGFAEVLAEIAEEIRLIREALDRKRARASTTESTDA